MAKSLVAVCVFCCVLMGSNAVLSQSALYKQGLSSATPVGAVLPKQGYVISGTSDTSLCNKAACDKTAGELSAASVKYCDMESHITICVCDDAPYKTASLASDYSQVPVYLRQTVDSVTAIYSGDGASGALTTGSQITLFSSSPVDTDLLVYQSALAQDNGYSSSDAWQQAISQDSCVPDAFAQTGKLEAYGQANVVWIYQQAKGSLPSPGGACMQHQLQTLTGRTAPGVQQFRNKAAQQALNSLLC